MTTVLIALACLALGLLVGALIGNVTAEDRLANRRPFPTDLRSAVLLHRAFWRSHHHHIPLQEIHSALVCANDIAAGPAIEAVTANPRGEETAWS